MTGARVFGRELTAGHAADGDEDGDRGPRLLAPAVGLFRPSQAREVIRAGTVIGELEVLGELVRVLAPAGAQGVLVDPSGGSIARRPVGYGDVLFTLDVEGAASIADGAEDGAASADASDAALVFRSPTSGRYYARPSPDAPPFVVVGDEVSVGQTIALLEVMKTFNRVQYGGAGVPERAKVVRVVPENESDLGSGDVILELAALD